MSIIHTPDKLKAMAMALAASIPPHLGHPTTPPTSWAQVGETVVVILADGRKVSGSIVDINRLMFDQKAVVKDAKADLDQVEIPPLAAASPAAPLTKSITTPRKRKKA